MIVFHLDIKRDRSFSGVAHFLQKAHDFHMARVVLLHNHTSGTRIHLAEKNMDTIFLAQGNMSALFYGHGNMSRNWNSHRSSSGVILYKESTSCSFDKPPSPINHLSIVAAHPSARKSVIKSISAGIDAHVMNFSR